MDFFVKQVIFWIGSAPPFQKFPNTQLTQTWVGGDASAFRLTGDSVVRELSSSPPAMDWEVRLQVSLGSDLWVRMSVTKRAFADLTDVTLADEDTNSILTDNVKRAIQGNVAMHVTQPGGKQCNGATWWPNVEPIQVVLAKFATHASGAISWSNLQLIQVAPSGGQICN